MLNAALPCTLYWLSQNGRLLSSQALQLRHKERYGVSHQQRLDCSFSRLFMHRSKKTSNLRVTGLCVEGIHRRPIISPYKEPVTRKMFHLMTSSWEVRFMHTQPYELMNQTDRGVWLIHICNLISWMVKFNTWCDAPISEISCLIMK